MRKGVQIKEFKEFEKFKELENVRGTGRRTALQTKTSNLYPRSP
jgi:hypothetical protein